MEERISQFENIYRLIQDNRIDDIRGMIDQDQLNFQSVDRQGYSILDYLIYSKDVEIVQEAIRRGANIHSRSNQGFSPLHIAAEHSDERMVECLIRNGAEVDAKNEALSTPLMFGIQSKNVGVVQVLLKQNVDVNHISSNGASALHIAGYLGLNEISLLLLENGADKTAKDSNGAFASALAMDEGHIETAKLIYEYGANQATGHDKFDDLVEQLIRIGLTSDNSNVSGYFIKINDNYEKNGNAYQIGRELYELGNHSINIMREACEYVEVNLGRRASSELSSCWHEIGLEDWQQNKGECWLH